jgi:hypothetical protein
MFGVNSALHAASRSAQTSFGAVQDSAAAPLVQHSTAVIWPSESPSFITAIPKHPDELGLDCAKTQAGEERKLDRFWANAVAQICPLDDDGPLLHGSRLHQRAEPRWHRAACGGARQSLRRGPWSSGLRPEFGE